VASGEAHAFVDAAQPEAAPDSLACHEINAVVDDAQLDPRA